MIKLIRLTCIVLLSFTTCASVLLAENARVRRISGPDNPQIYKYNLDLGQVNSNRTDLVRILPGGRQIIPPAVWEVVVRDVVAYVWDVPFDELQTTTEKTTSQPRPTTQVMAIGDIREINGRPVRGTYSFRAMPILTTPNPSPQTGFTLADSTRIAQLDHVFEIFQEDGTPLGSLFGFGAGLGPATPGAPVGAEGGTLAIIGGTGPYLAMRGQLNTGPPIDENTPFLRFASGSEHPAVRRLNGGGVTPFLLHLIPHFSPEVVLLDETLPAVFHSEDLRLVTQNDPARPGEVLTMLVRHLGPTNPQVNPGEKFPRSPISVVNSPVEVLVNGGPATLLFAGGEPGAVDVYEVEFRLPTDVVPGLATIQVLVGFLPGPEFQIWIR